MGDIMKEKLLNFRVYRYGHGEILADAYVLGELVLDAVEVEPADFAETTEMIEELTKMAPSQGMTITTKALFPDCGVPFGFEIVLDAPGMGKVAREMFGLYMTKNCESPFD